MTARSKRIPAKAATVLGTAVALACAGPVVAADSGGTAYDSSAASAQPAKRALLGNPVTFTGQARRGTTIAVQRLENGTWTTVATATAGRSNRYSASWRTDEAGTFQMRAVPSGSAVRASSTTDPVQVVVYKRYVSTWYGKGWEGRKTACGYTISPSLMGVANKTLPCGTKVSFLFHGRTVTVPVVDRGPYGKGISWDLTTAAADALGFTATGKGTVGAVVLKKR